MTLLPVEDHLRHLRHLRHEGLLFQGLSPVKDAELSSSHLAFGFIVQ